MSVINSVLSVSHPQKALKVNSLGLYLASAAFAAGNLLLPMAVHGIPNGGIIFLPLFFFTLVAGWRYGWLAGVVVALLSPVLNHVLTGMPPVAMMPSVLFKGLAFGLVAALVASRSKKISLVLMAAVVVAVQLVGTAFDAVLFGSVPRALGGLQMGIPGMLVMVLGGYLVVRVLAALEARSQKESE